MPKSRNKRKAAKKRNPAAARKGKSTAPPIPDRRAMERVLSSLSLGGDKSPDSEHQAQELIYDAWETPDHRRRVTMAREALELWPDCADAWVLLAEETARSVEEAAELYEQGMRAGQRALGEAPFKEDVGHFWGLLETRPYMRARAGYAQALERLGCRDEAVEHYRDLLRLNPGDNQGIRYVLLRLLVDLDRDEDARDLIENTGDEITAAWPYTEALLAFRRGEEASALLQDAFQKNRHVPAYLLGRRRLPKNLPDYIGLGDRSEAVTYAAEYKTIWRKTPGALGWLRESLSES